MTEVLDNHFDILASRRTQEALKDNHWQLASDRQALEIMAGRVGVTVLPLPPDVRVILTYKPPGSRRPDKIDYPDPTDKNQAYLRRHDIYVTTPVLEEGVIGGLLAKELYTHEELSPETAELHRRHRLRRYGFRGLVVAGVMELGVAYYLSGDPATAATITGGVMSMVGLAGEGYESLSHAAQMALNPAGHPSLDGLSSPIGLIRA